MCCIAEAACCACECCACLVSCCAKTLCCCCCTAGKIKMKFCLMKIIIFKNYYFILAKTASPV